MEQENKKLLVLSLGSGNLDNMATAYKAVQYRDINGELYKKDDKNKKTSFVAEPLISEFKPDQIVILGTVKSVWHLLYYSFLGRTPESSETNLDGKKRKTYTLKFATKKELDRFKKLYDTESSKDHTEEKDGLGRIEEAFNEAFDSISNEEWKKYTGEKDYDKPEIHILLLRYGVNNEELTENYKIIKNIENWLDENHKYEVAFDITHSFRSLAIYNLVIFNYIKNLSKYNLEIKHVFYGNLDVQGEMSGVAPILDLGELVNVFDLTGGVMEFKDTGNAGALLSMLPHDDYYNLLSDFDLESQLNSFNMIKKDIMKLLKESSSASSPYSDVKEMVTNVLREQFFENRSDSEINKLDDVAWKMLLTEWYFKQNRYGLGLATGLEALRDMNTKVFSPNDFTRPTIRQNVEDMFINSAVMRKNLEVDSDSKESVLISIGSSLREIKGIRNEFAHSLGSQRYSMPEIREKIDRFRSDLRKTYDIYMDPGYQSNYKAFFLMPGSGTTATTPSSRKCRIVLDIRSASRATSVVAYSRYKQSNSGANFDVYRLKDDVRNWFFKEDDNEVLRGYWLLEYLKTQISKIGNYGEIIIILYESENSNQNVVYISRLFLETMNEDGFLPGTAFSIASDRGDGFTSLKKTYIPIAFESIDASELEALYRGRIEQQELIPE